jgi:hypothetical protein
MDILSGKFLFYVQVIHSSILLRNFRFISGSFQIEKPIMGSSRSVYIQSDNIKYQVNKLAEEPGEQSERSIKKISKIKTKAFLNNKIIDDVPDRKDKFEFKIEYTSELFERNLTEKRHESKRMRLSNLTKKFLVMSDQKGFENFDNNVEKYFKNLIAYLFKRTVNIKKPKQDLSSYLGIRVRKV